ncbi:MAG: DUF2460 domain-containing protein [Bacteroidales bacterium]|jgi:uncharacterized protein (TIGR02217 family)|nr:DUF2460 domain-containing protein [Bacteroidales bacterium]
MGRIAAILDEDVDYGFEGGPRYKTGSVDLENGFFDKDSQWIYPRHEFSAQFGNIDDARKDRIIAVFHACRGTRHSFMFKDWNDFEVVSQEIAVEFGTTNTIQLYKTYEPFGPPYVTIRPIQALNWATITDYNGDVVAGSYNLLTGEFTPSAAWGSGVYTLNCDFYVWVFFENDYNPMTINNWKANTSQVSLIEDKFEFSATNVPASWEE